MRRARFVGLWLVATVGCLMAGVASAGGPGQFYKYGRTAAERRVDEAVAHWREKGLAASSEMIGAICNGEPGLVEPAEMVLAELGAPALQALIRASIVPRCHFEMSIARILCRGTGETELLGMLGSHNASVVRTGAAALERMLQAGEVGMCSDGSHQLLTSAVPALARPLRIATGDALYALLSLALKMGPVAAPLVPDLIPALQKDDTASTIAAYALRAIGPAAAPAVPALRAKLQRRGTGYTAAIPALAATREAARPALPDLAPLLTEALPRICVEGRFDREAGATAELIVGSASAIGGPGVEAMVPDAIAAFEAKRRCDPGHYASWIKYFGQFGGYGTAALPMLRAIVEDPNADLAARRQALRSIDEIGLPAKWRPKLEELRQAFARRQVVFDAPRPPDPDYEGDLQSPGGPDPPPLTPRLFGLCRKEAGLPPIDDPPAPPGEGPNHSGFEICVRHRLCGPSESDYRATMAKCCDWYRKPHSGPVPWFCEAATTSPQHAGAK